MYHARFCTGSTPAQSGRARRRTEAPHGGDEGGEVGSVDRGGGAAHPGAPAWGYGIESAEAGCGRLLVLVMLGLLPRLEMVF